MEMTTNYNVSGGDTDQNIYSYKLENNNKKKRCKIFQTTICSQIFAVFLFALGLLVGLLIGVFAFHGGHTDKKCEQYVSSNENNAQSLANIGQTPKASIPPNTSLKPDRSVTLTTVPITSSTKSTSGNCKKCSWQSPLRKPTMKEVFAPLNRKETDIIYEIFLERNITNIRRGETLSINNNFIQSMFLHPPNKKEALEYLDKGGQFPGRYATVSFYGGAENPPVFMHYKVGPLEQNVDNIKILPLLEREEVPYNKRPYDPAEAKMIIIFVLEELEAMPNLLQESFDNVKPFDDLTVLPNGPYTDDSERRLSRITIGMRGLGDRDFDFFNILPLTLKLYHGGLNSSEWYTYDYYYLNQGPYPNATYLNAAYYWGYINKIEIPKGSRQTMKELTFPRRDIYQPLRLNANVPPTKTYEPSGPRYTIAGHTVAWMGWSFSVNTNQHRGPSVYNVKFKGERIVYENSLNDIALVYSADGSGQDNMVYIDSMYGIGGIKKVILGVDCPEYSTLLNITKWDAYSSKAIIIPGICIFEADGQNPLWRHTGNSFKVGLVNRYLVARIPATVGNYDYIFDFHFYLDGKMKNTVSATGFIQGSFWNPISPYFGNTTGESPFGYKVSPTAVGIIHDHTFGFKVDLDVVDEINNFDIIHWKYGDIKTALSSKSKVNDTPSYFLYNHSRYIEWERLKEEAGLKVDMVNQKYWIVVNDRHRNAWDVGRGYRIIPMATSAQNIENDFPFMKDISFTKYHCAVTKRKESELYLRPLHELVRNLDPNKPKRYLEDMIDGESIQNEDIVTWVSVGFLHIPTSEDVPMTTRVETGFTLKPFNFFDRTATFDMPQYNIENNTLYESEPTAEPCYENQL